MAQTFHHSDERWLLLVVRADPGEANAERDEIGAQGDFRLRPNQPSHPIITPMALRKSRSERSLADATQAVQHRDRDPALVAR